MLQRYNPSGQLSFDSAAKCQICLMCMLSFVFPAGKAQNTTEAQDAASRGLSFARSRKWEEAEQELRKAVRAAPSVAVYHAQLGSILGLEGRWSESLTSFQRAVELAPSDINFRERPLPCNGN
jgi:Tfp pilus assembly protein PilF